ncbi:DUF2971 domain-containing protein, partial [Porticoccus sp.]
MRSGYKAHNKHMLSDWFSAVLQTSELAPNANVMNLGDRMAHNPELLYKYKGIDEYALKAISTGRLYYASRSDFNDPIDSHPHFENDVNKQSLAKLLEYFTNNKGINPSTISVDDAQSEIERNIERRLDDTGVLSMSSSYDSPLMWSHYANNHKGVCLGFRRNKAKEESRYYYPKLVQVAYNRPRL